VVVEPIPPCVASCACKLAIAAWISAVVIALAVPNDIVKAVAKPTNPATAFTARDFLILFIMYFFNYYRENHFSFSKNNFHRAERLISFDDQLCPRHNDSKFLMHRLCPDQGEAVFVFTLWKIQGVKINFTS
jgi:hypothetical protein